MTAEPSPVAVTTPLWFTVATLVSVLPQFTLCEAVLGVTVAVIVLWSPTYMLSELRLSVSPVARGWVMVTVHDFESPS